MLTGIVTAVALLTIAVLGGGGTFALWKGNAATGASVVRSGTSTVAVGALTSTRSPVLAPGTAAIGTFTVKNTGSTSLAMRVAVTATSVAYSGASDAATLDELTLNLSLVASAAACKAGLGGSRGRLATFDTGSGYYTMAPGVSGVGCVEVDLDADAPQTVSGAVANYTITVTGTQVAP